MGGPFEGQKKIKWPKSANIILFNRLLAPGGGGALYYGFSVSKVTIINYLSLDLSSCPPAAPFLYLYTVQQRELKRRIGSVVFAFLILTRIASGESICGSR